MIEWEWAVVRQDGRLGTFTPADEATVRRHMKRANDYEKGQFTSKFGGVTFHFRVLDPLVSAIMAAQAEKGEEHGG